MQVMHLNREALEKLKLFVVGTVCAVLVAKSRPDERQRAQCDGRWMLQYSFWH